MPLLMKEPTGLVPSETALDVPGGEARAFHAHQGQLLSIIDTKGQQPASLFSFVTSNHAEFLSPHHTRVFSNSFLLNLGMRLVTNHRRPIMVLGKDTVGTHDLLWPALDASYLSSHGVLDTGGCIENARNALTEFGVSPPKLPDPVNLFLNVELDSTGALTPKPLQSRAGDHVLFRVLIDCICVVSAAHKDPNGWSKAPPTMLQVSTLNQVPL